MVNLGLWEGASSLRSGLGHSVMVNSVQGFLVCLAGIQGGGCVNSADIHTHRHTDTYRYIHRYTHIDTDTRTGIITCTHFTTFNHNII